MTTGIFPNHDAFEAVFAEEAAMIEASELIAEALAKTGISQAELARRLRVSRSEVTARLRGERNISVRKLAATLHALGARLELDMSDGDMLHRRTSTPFSSWHLAGLQQIREMQPEAISHFVREKYLHVS